MRRIVFSLAALGLVSCSVGPNYERPDLPVPSEFSATRAADASVELPPAAWWESFRDPALVQLVECALANNLTVEAALARVNRSRALRREAFFDLGPTGDLVASYTNRKSSLVDLEGIPNPPRTREIYSLGFDSMWELDIWGGGRRNYERVEAEEAAAIAELDDALVTVIGEVARNYLELRGLQRQLEVTIMNGKLQEDSTGIIEVRADRGEISALDRARARSQLFQTLALVDPLRARIDEVTLRLAVLAGAIPGSLSETLREPKPIPVFAGPLTIGNPAEMLERRPDVRAAERRLAALTAAKGVAVSAFFPRLSFSGTLAWQSSQTQNLLTTSGAESFVFGPRLLWPLFDLPTVWAQAEAADASIAEGLALYKESVLLAIEDVEGSLARFTGRRARRELLEKAVAESNEAVNLSKLRFEEGLDDFLTLLEAQRDKLIVELELVEAEQQLAVDIVSIYKALGGGWAEAALVAGGSGEVSGQEEAAEATEKTEDQTPESRPDAWETDLPERASSDDPHAPEP